MKWKVQKQLLTIESGRASKVQEDKWEDVSLHETWEEAGHVRSKLYREYLKNGGDSFFVYRVVGVGTARVMDIYESTMADGPGLRTSIYFAGCLHKCPGCHNKESWDFNAGKEMDIEDIVKRVINSSDKGVTFSGGDPAYQGEVVAEIARRIKIATEKTIWMYSGFTLEEIKTIVPFGPEMLAYIDVVVDGTFVERLKDEKLRFRGSSNQRFMLCESGQNITNLIDDFTYQE